jgi:Endonuclease/Exonuclease/phosphatase family
VLDARPYHVNLGGSGGKETTRDILYVNGILAGDTVHVLVNHWPSRRGGEAVSAPKRAIAAGIDRKIVDSLMAVNPGNKVFIMGDLNDDPVSPSIVNVLGATSERSSVKENGIYNPWVPYYKKGLGTLAWDDAWNLFDQIMLTAPFLKKDDNHWQYYKAEVFSKEFLKEKYGQYKGQPHRSFSGETWINGYSDHFPTVVYLVKKQ